MDFIMDFFRESTPGRKFVVARTKSRAISPVNLEKVSEEARLFGNSLRDILICSPIGIWSVLDCTGGEPLVTYSRPPGEYRRIQTVFELYSLGHSKGGFISSDSVGAVQVYSRGSCPSSLGIEVYDFHGKLAEFTDRIQSIDLSKFILARNLS